MSIGGKGIALSSGCVLPLVGFGTWKSKPGEVKAAVKAAIDAGYRLIDCAYGYGNEGEVGEAITESLQAGKVKREDLFIISKLWNTRHEAPSVKPSFLESLTNLGLSYIDLYLIHWPIALKSGGENFPRDAAGNLIYADVGHIETWTELEKLVDEGLAKSIGLSNFNSQQIQNILDQARIKPAVLQVEIHPYLQQDKLLAFCQERGVTVMAYSPFGSPDRPWASPNDPSILDDPKLKDVATKYKKSVPQVILRWLMQRHVVPVAKSVTPARIAENFKVFDFELSAEDMKLIATYDRNIRLVVPYVDLDGKRVFRDRNAPNFPFHIEF